MAGKPRSSDIFAERASKTTGHWRTSGPSRSRRNRSPAERGLDGPGCAETAAAPAGRSALPARRPCLTNDRREFLIVSSLRKSFTLEEACAGIKPRRLPRGNLRRAEDVDYITASETAGRAGALHE